MLFENIDNSYLNAIMNINKEDDTTLFLKGNMFEKEYVPYKNLTYIKPEIKTEREKILFKIMKLSFEINDYNLYLDLHPEDTMIFKKYKDSINSLKDVTDAYEKKYGPLCTETLNQQEFNWIKSPWPWDKEDGKYV